MRDSLLSILYQATKTKKSGDDKEQFKIVIKNKKQAVSVIGDLETEKITVNFADGKSEDNFDIVIGADGISSTVKQFTEYGDRTVLSLLPDTGINAAAQSNNVNGKIVDPKYTGIRITYCVTPPSQVTTKKVPTKKTSFFDSLTAGFEPKRTTTVKNTGVKVMDVDLSSLRSEGRGAFHRWLGDGCYALAASYGGLEGLQHMLAVVCKKMMTMLCMEILPIGGKTLCKIDGRYKHTPKRRNREERWGGELG